MHMRSIFTVSPPSFTITEVSEILIEKYSIDGNVSELYSDRDQNFHVNDDGKKHVLKISNAMEDRSVLELQDLASKHMMLNDPTIQIPTLASEIIEIKKGREVFFMRLMHYLEGNFLGEQGTPDVDPFNVGTFLGRVSCALDGFDHPGAHRPFEWDARQTELIRKISEHVTSRKDQDTVGFFLNEFEKVIPTLVKDMRMSVIHNDGNDHNILVDGNGKIIGLIDFGDMVHSHQALEPAVAMAYAALDNDDPFASITSMLRGYHSMYPLTKNEVLSTIYLMCSRLCITVSMAAWRKRLFPENTYLTISESSAWSLLRMMEKEDLSVWSNRLVEHAG